VTVSSGDRMTRPRHASDDGTRRTEILATAASLIATSGLRTSMHDIAQAAGIQTGSLYHHFDSKEALLVELLRRYHDDLDRVADQALQALDEPSNRPGFAAIATLGVAIARCAVAHRAAIQISMYETPSANPDLIKWTQHRPTTVLEAMYQTLRAGRWGGYLRSDIDLRVLADRISQTMLQVGLDVLRRNAATERVATVLCRVMLEGLAAAQPSDAELSGSAAFAAADSAIRSWSDDIETDDKAARIRAVARTEFGRRGYEGTTVRDIAAAANIGHGTVFRLIGSKEELLASIMGGFGEKTELGARKVLRSDSSPIEKLDALSWININALERFGDEFRIQLAWMRQIPPDAPNPSVEFPTRLKQTKKQLSQGIQSGLISVDDAPRDMLARCVISLQWLPETILHDVGAHASLTLVRDTMLRGAAEPVA
jgi:AcrR family transcriptional regulator